jgi:hypothetical protein
MTQGNTAKQLISESSIEKLSTAELTTIKEKRR